MSNIANIPALNYAGATVPFIPSQGSSGDGSPAIWRIANGPSHATAYEIRFTARDSARGKARSFRATAQFPHSSTDADTGLTTVHCIGRGAAEFSFDKDVPITLLQDWATLFFTALGSRVSGAILDGVTVNSAPR